MDVETATVNDLARSSRVPRAKLYEVLESLNRKGLLDIIPDSPQRFRANPLTALYDTRLEELRNEEQQLKRTIGEMMLQLMPQSHERQSESERDFLHLARGRVPFVTSLKQLVQRTEHKLTVWADPLFLARLRLYEDLIAGFLKLAKTAELRILVPSNSVDVVDGRRVYADEVGSYTRVRAATGGDVLFALRDRAEALEVHFVPNDLHPSRGSDRVVINRDPEMVGALEDMTSAAWDSARPFGTAAVTR